MEEIVLRREIEVIIPFHRNDAFLRDAIRSVHDSSGVKIRIIAVNDTGQQVSATDLSLQRSDLLIATIGKGYQDAISSGVRRLSAEYVGFLDSDDLTHPRRFERQIQSLMQSNSKISVGKLRKIFSNGKLMPEANPLGAGVYDSDIRKSWLFGTHGADSSIVAQTELIQASWHNHQVFPKQFADFAWLLGQSLSHEIVQVPDGIYFYRMHRAQMSRYNTDWEEWKYIFPMWQKALQNTSDHLERVLDKFSNYRISLPIVFPSSLVKFTSKEANDFDALVEELLDNFHQIYEDSESAINALLRRQLLVRRALAFRHPIQSGRLIYELGESFLLGLRPRR